jgi:putative Mg2+ transporter-C (MgtC) family protein
MILTTFFDTVTNPKITLGSAIFKLLLSFLAGGIMGFNREQRKHAAGFRTHILICMGSTLLMILSIYIPQTYFDFKNGDPGRIAAQVVSGIGFLGAGAILKLGNNVRGLTTAASIWLISAIGLTIGAGLYTLSFITVLFAIFTLVVLERTEHKWFPQFHTKKIQIKFNDKDFPDDAIKAILQKNNIQILDYSLTFQNDSGIHSVVDMTVKMPEKTDVTELANKFNKLHAMHSVKISC